MPATDIALLLVPLAVLLIIAEGARRAARRNWRAVLAAILVLLLAAIAAIGWQYRDATGFGRLVPMALLGLIVGPLALGAGLGGLVGWAQRAADLRRARRLRAAALAPGGRSA